MGQLAFLRMFILVAISLDVNDNRRHVHIFKKGMRHQHSLAKIWIEKNGETAPYTFTAEMYSSFDEDITELPWDANYYSWDNSHSIYFYDEAEVFSEWTKVGIQSIYYGAGEVRKSNIDWIGNPELGTGISDIAVGQQAAKTVYFNLSGQRLHAPRKGLNIVKGRVVMVK